MIKRKEALLKCSTVVELNLMSDLPNVVQELHFRGISRHFVTMKAESHLNRNCASIQSFLAFKKYLVFECYCELKINS